MREYDEDAGEDAVQHWQLLEVLGRFEEPAPTAAQKLQRLQLGPEVLVVRCLIVVM